MPKSCIICSRSWKKSQRSLHMFPRLPHLRILWFEMLGLKAEWTETIYLCSDHFSPDSYFIHSRGRKLLKKNAIPLKIHQASSSSVEDDNLSAASSSSFSMDEHDINSEGSSEENEIQSILSDSLELSDESASNEMEEVIIELSSESSLFSVDVDDISSEGSTEENEIQFILPDSLELTNKSIEQLNTSAAASNKVQEMTNLIELSSDSSSFSMDVQDVNSKRSTEVNEIHCLLPNSLELSNKSAKQLNTTALASNEMEEVTTLIELSSESSSFSMDEHDENSEGSTEFIEIQSIWPDSLELSNKSDKQLNTLAVTLN